MYKARVNLLKDQTKATKAMVDLTISDVFVVKGLRVIEGKNGLFVSMPQRKNGEEMEDTAFPITKEAREQINKAVLEAYEAKIKQ